VWNIALIEAWTISSWKSQVIKMNKNPKNLRMVKFKVQVKCIKCPACDHTGWKTVAKDMRKHWQKYYGPKLKVRYISTKVLRAQRILKNG
jgi:hypothetical protein